MKLLISQNKTDIHRIDEFRTIYIKPDNTMLLGLSSDDTRTTPIGRYDSKFEAKEALRVLAQRLASDSRVVMVPTQDEVKDISFYKERADNGKKTVRRGGS